MLVPMLICMCRSRCIPPLAGMPSVYIGEGCERMRETCLARRLRPAQLLISECVVCRIEARSREECVPQQHTAHTPPCAGVGGPIETGHLIDCIHTLHSLTSSSCLGAVLCTAAIVTCFLFLLPGKPCLHLQLNVPGQRPRMRQMPTMMCGSARLVRFYHRSV